VARTHGDDVTEQRAPGEGEVADDIEDFVADEFVFEAQGFFAQGCVGTVVTVANRSLTEYSYAGEFNGTCQRCTKCSLLERQVSSCNALNNTVCERCPALSWKDGLWSCPRRPTIAKCGVRQETSGRSGL
jgi:hypothetical protein